jgi:farnesyl diphosphate synthase
VIDISDNKCSWVINTALAILDPSPVSDSSMTPPSYHLTTNEAFYDARSSLSLARKSELRAILDENYGRKDEKKEEKVKAVFNELAMVKIYEEYEEFTYQRLMEKIDGIPEGEGNILRRDVFKMFLEKM